MSSLAFILNPLERSAAPPVSPAAAASSASLPTTPTATLGMKRPLPTLAAAVGASSMPQLSVYALAAAAQQQQQQFLRALAPLTTIAAHQAALGVSRLRLNLSKDNGDATPRKKQRVHVGENEDTSTTHSHHHHHNDDEDDEDDDGAASPTTSSEGEMSSGEDGGVADKLHASKKKTRLCKEKGCSSLAVSRRSCVRHGGGSRCTVEGCTNGAKLRNRCFQHGGSTICLAAGCSSKAKRYGYCWSHGGGRICSAEGCVKVAAQGGSCWAHGGGNRCRLEGCSKRSYQKHGYYCKAHASFNV